MLSPYQNSCACQSDRGATMSYHFGEIQTNSCVCTVEGQRPELWSNGLHSCLLPLSFLWEDQYFPHTIASFREKCFPLYKSTEKPQLLRHGRAGRRGDSVLCILAGRERLRSSTLPPTDHSWQCPKQRLYPAIHSPFPYNSLFRPASYLKSLKRKPSLPVSLSVCKQMG